jgi:heme oxygenase
LANLGFTGDIQTHTFDTKSFEWLVGAAYVFEGSTMGGMFMSKELSQIEFAKHAHSYFTPYGLKTMQMWQEFGEFLVKVEHSGELDTDKIILSACENFLLVKSEIAIAKKL